MTPLRRLRRAAIDVEPLRHATFRRLWAGNSLGFVGFQLTAVAVAVQVYELTGSSFWVGMLVGLVGLVLFGRWGGAVADAVDRRVLLLLGSSLLLWGCTGVAKHRATIWGRRTIATNRDFAGALPPRQPRRQLLPLLRETLS
jgi:hypothetical protein